ncbi:MAG: DNA polymerase III subunit gamma/tau [Candidatus Levybacteria bacterium]|nr:DNA polymerase III subunit gamma/tau [Candidatus Levybacteria bacterium]
MVFYRKYRPQKIDELDNSEVREKLTAFLAKKSSIHALLFTGPKGLGKTSAARIVAKAVNCEKLRQKSKGKSQKSVLEPCNKCAQCVSITNGTNIDVLEIDGASNRGIDEIRDLREKVRLSPAGAHKKIYIIDEVHMLTTEAFNALLKTLEEPPNHVVFILCTTEPHKVPATIVSRCFHIVFKRATMDELIRSFLRIAKQEKISIDKDALSAISDLSDGSFRDGVKILEEIHSGIGNRKITKEIVEKKFQISNLSSYISGMFRLLTEKDVKGSLEMVGKMTEQGIDMKFFLEQLILKMHELLLINVGVVKDKEPEASLSLDEIKELTELFVRASSQLKFAVLPQMPLEMAIVEWCIGAEVAHENFPVRNAGKNLPEIPKSDGANANRENFVSFPRQDIFAQLIAKVKPHNHSAAGLLRGCILKNFDGKKLEIEAKFKFHKEKLEDVRVRTLIEKVIEEITGKKVKMSVLLRG